MNISLRAARTPSGSASLCRVPTSDYVGILTHLLIHESGPMPVQNLRGPYTDA
jgi:hypothetical protein